MANDTQATQEFVPIEDIRDGILTLKDGSLRAVLMASSINFALKSEDEQASILFQFQNFLNSIEFSVQFFVQSRPLDIRPYLALLESRLEAQTEDLMRIQIREYIGFIKQFTESTKIMSKNFFIVVPYSPPALQIDRNFLSKVVNRKKQTKEDKTASFEENRAQLEQRMDVVTQGLMRTGVRVVPLGTEETIELFYKLFNPGELEKPISLLNQ